MIGKEDNRYLLNVVCSALSFLFPPPPCPAIGPASLMELKEVNQNVKIMTFSKMCLIGLSFLFRLSIMSSLSEDPEKLTKISGGASHQ